MKFLFKFPSRGRPDRFKSTLLEHIKMLSKNHEYIFIFSFDTDDLSMNNSEIRKFIENLNLNCKIHYGTNKNKIEAINANIDDESFDILVLLSDDMIPTMKNYDEIIFDIFEKNIHGLDSVIHFNTTRWSNILDIWCVMGKKYYDRFKYIYNPEYKSIFSDNEYTEVSRMLDRYYFSELIPFNHDHRVGDETEVKNWQFNIDDSQTYNFRRKKNFDLRDFEIKIPLVDI